ncbi:MAG: dTDP-4-dehydrorhamnose 3,5-epimerase [Bacteroidota bacterium]
MGFRKLDTEIEGLVIIEPDWYGDHRGFFKETYNVETFRAMGLDLDFKQDNVSFSGKGILRGLHFQAPPHAQGKLVTVLQGEAIDVAVDIRKSSPTYGQHQAVRLTGENHRMFWVPPGFAHGFAVLSETCYFCYKCTDTYHPESEGGLLWNDPALGINWEITDAQISKRDGEWPAFGDFVSPFE